MDPILDFAYSMPSQTGWRMGFSGWIELVFEDENERDMVVGTAAVAADYGRSKKPVIAIPPNHSRRCIMVPVHDPFKKLGRLMSIIGSDMSFDVLLCEVTQNHSTILLIDRLYPTRFNWVERQIKLLIPGSDPCEYEYEPMFNPPVETRRVINGA